MTLWTGSFSPPVNGCTGYSHTRKDRAALKVIQFLLYHPHDQRSREVCILSDAIKMADE